MGRDRLIHHVKPTVCFVMLCLLNTAGVPVDLVECIEMGMTSEGSLCGCVRVPCLVLHFMMPNPVYRNQRAFFLACFLTFSLVESCFTLSFFRSRGPPLPIVYRSHCSGGVVLGVRGCS